MNLSIETENLGKNYGDVRAVEHLSLRVAEGEIYAFLGLNGAGKTTTIRMLLGMIKPTTGYAQVLQTRVRLGRTGTLGSGGVSGGDPACLSGIDGPREPGGRPSPASWHPHRKRSTRLSSAWGWQLMPTGGPAPFRRAMRSAWDWLKLCCMTPRLLILDEPTLGLDPAGIVEIRELLLELTRRTGCDGLHVQSYPGRSLTPCPADRDYPPWASAPGTGYR